MRSVNSGDALRRRAKPRNKPSKKRADHFWNDTNWRTRYLMHQVRWPFYAIMFGGYAFYGAFVATLDFFVENMPWYVVVATALLWGTLLYYVQLETTKGIMKRRWAEWGEWIEGEAARLRAIERRLTPLVPWWGEALRQEQAQQNGDALPTPPIAYRPSLPPTHRPPTRDEWS